MSAKRPRQRQTASPERSASPTLPLHLYTSLPANASSSSSSSFTTAASRDPALAHLALHAIEAREATLLDPAGERVERERVVWTGWVNGDDEPRRVETDRYDILHLLPSIPQSSNASTSTPTSRTAPPFELSSGFDDLPSDHEELFFLNSKTEREDIERRKKRRRIEEERERRVRERMRQDGEREGFEGAETEGDEPPTEIQHLMSRLLSTLARSANPSLLELRILANHGSDPRFASFLKREGRWRGWWEDFRAGKKGGKGGQEEKDGEGKDEEAKEEEAKGGLGGLAGYGSDSDSEAESGGDKDGEKEQQVQAEHPAQIAADDLNSAEPLPPLPPDCTSTTSNPANSPLPAPAPVESRPISTTTAVTPTPTPAEEDREEERTKKELRAAKAREWARKRREARGVGDP
ncbi:hypothetical protein JCM10908_001466 [Rhodotorula pacifica]|uniref:uncharacterized protein n=1 Tax=Rhodotorula pacifica TaxID=1495444 RepID=UPI003178520B